MSKSKKIVNDIKIFALGGLGEVGKNMYCIDYLDQLFVIDAGILFPDETLLGIDYVIPDYQYLKDNEERIVGLFITHGHEDHIGGIPFLLKKVKIPKIYASGVAIDLIEHKMEDNNCTRVPIIEFKSHFTFEFKDVELSFIRLNHSIPDAFMLVFKTSLGSIIHSGDFKFDFTPVGPMAEFEKLTQVGASGVLCLLSDSTNALLEGFTQSEKRVGGSIKDLFTHIPGRIIVATFASNIYRVQQIVEASVMNNRKIAIFGRSMEKTIEVGTQIGYIKAPKGTFIEANEINSYPLDKLTLLCTGSQGEPLAALSRVANGSHRFIKLMPDDTVIFSSSPIPGNQEGINNTINLLFKNGANVITHSPLTDTHTSGHGAQEELKLMISLTKPKYFIPVHGEYRMQRVHANLAIECGVKKEDVFVMQNGEVLTINQNGASITHSVTSGEIYIDGNDLGDFGSKILKERKSLAKDGLFAVIFVIDAKTRRMLAEPQVVSRGFIYMKDNEELTKYFLTASSEYVRSELSKSKGIPTSQMRTGLIDLLHSLISEKTDRQPVIRPIFVLLNKRPTKDKSEIKEKTTN